MSPHRQRKPINPTFRLQPEHRFTSRRFASGSRVGSRARSNLSGDLAVLDLESTLPPSLGSAGSCDLSGLERLDGRGGVQRGRDSGTLSSTYPTRLRSLVGSCKVQGSRIWKQFDGFRSMCPLDGFVMETGD
ncbi:hypothetical protein RJ639_045773 [Escallonia herrerae]|uniref:Uncharacterized protein n=1 Tax=Escallonia herrerae TaxID=1293975 RepID=A0AA89B2H1_9ASTE|nr:hypothetical protein RJ639_045773 [Escallonia herrerae]